MGTSIELTVGGASLSYAKNHMGMDFGFLFQEKDEMRRKSDAINYEYFEENPEEKPQLEEMEACFVRPLSETLPRLPLLGYTIETARAEYNAILSEAHEMASDLDQRAPDSGLLSFDEFCELANRYPLSTLERSYIEEDEEAKGRLKEDRDFARVPWTDVSDLFWSEVSYFAATMTILSPEHMLLVFGQNPENADQEVIWEFGPLVDAGWASRESFQAGARRKQKVLIATEGASDARIIKRAIGILRPNVADFFNFVDVEEKHHFWGTGNLAKFAEGILRIDIHNRVLFVFDNDAEGVDACQKVNALELSPNMRAMLLPDLDDFRSFATQGPEGASLSDINGKAAAIECYLDLEHPNHSPAKVLWSNYKKSIDAWHGALEFKESYQRYFYKQSADDLKGGKYDTSKLVKLLDRMIEEPVTCFPEM